jgi:hypothetical protein
MNNDRTFYTALVRREIVSSARELSRYIGMADNYISDRGDRPLSLLALRRLFSRLLAEHHYILASRVAWAILFGEAPQ